MIGRPMVVHLEFPQFTSMFSCQLKQSSDRIEVPQNFLHLDINRRVASIAALSSVLLAGEAFCITKSARGFDFPLVAPGPTLEDAESGISSHARALLGVKDLLDSESWGEAQKLLRNSSASLKLDIYAIIQGKPGDQRPQLRNLYSKLFNNVTSLDYAARDKDVSRVQMYYANMVGTLNEILSRI